ncbi:MAG TPA: putative O-glycosylation ligase, exosortase A system-associated, partial [Acetobacteraceae bacterium]
ALGLGIHGALEGLKYIASAGGHLSAAPPSFGDNNNFGLALLMCFPVLLYLYRYSVVKHVRLGLAGGAVLNFVGIMCTNSRGALLGLVAMATAYILRSRRKVSGMLALAAVGGLVLVLAPDRWTQRMDTISNAGQDGSFVGRMVSWKLNTVMALERPLGGGFSALEDRRVFEAYRPRINTTLTIFPVEMPDIALAAHSIYFEALGDNGFPGLLLFVSLLFIAFASLRKVRRLTRDHPTLGWAYDLADTMRLMMIGYTVAGAALSMAYFELFYITITLISVLRHLVVKEVRATVPARSPAPMIGNRALAPAQTRWL